MASCPSCLPHPLSCLPKQRQSSCLINAPLTKSVLLKSYTSMIREDVAEWARCPFPACLARVQRLGHRLRQAVRDMPIWPGIERTFIDAVGDDRRTGAVFPQKPV